VREIVPVPGFDPVTIQPVVSYYTDCTILGRFCIIVRCCQLHEQTSFEKVFHIQGEQDGRVVWDGPTVSFETVLITSSCRSFQQTVPLSHSVGPLSETTLQGDMTVALNALAETEGCY
jgi:hypothetical protein